AVRDRDAQAVQRNRAPGVQGAVDRVDHHAQRVPRAAEADQAPLLGDGRELVSRLVKSLELGEHRLLAEPVDRQGAIAALPDALVPGAFLDSDVLGEDPLLALNGSPAGGDPLVGARTRGAIGLRRLAAASCLTHRRTRGQISEPNFAFRGQEWRTHVLAWTRWPSIAMRRASR